MFFDTEKLSAETLNQQIEMGPTNCEKKYGKIDVLDLKVLKILLF